MNKKKVIVFSPISECLQNKLSEKYSTEFINLKDSKNHARFLQSVVDADALIGATCQLGESNLEGAKKLKVISSISAGYDNYDLDYLKKKKIILTHTPQVLTETTADLAFGLLMSAARQIPKLSDWTKEGKWESAIGSEFFGQDIFGKTLGIVGLGNIGAAIARRGFYGFNMNIIYHNRKPNPELAEPLNANYYGLEELLKKADFVVVAVSLNTQSKALIGKKQFDAMQSHAILINTARGSVIDEAALVDALKDKKIFAAGLDVYEKEPLQESALFNLDNAITVPHIGSATALTRHKMQELALLNLEQVLEGQYNRYIVN